MIKYLSFFLLSGFIYANTCYLLVGNYKKLPFGKQEYYMMGLADQLKSQFESAPNRKTKKIISCMGKSNSTSWADKLNTFMRENPNFKSQDINKYCVVDIYGQVVFDECF